MAFLSKLKDRLFKSSSKLDEGLEAIVQDGGTAETAADDGAAAAQQAQPVPGAPPEPPHEPVPVPPVTPPEPVPDSPDIEDPTLPDPNGPIRQPPPVPTDPDIDDPGIPTPPDPEAPHPPPEPPPPITPGMPPAPAAKEARGTASAEPGPRSAAQTVAPSPVAEALRPEPAEAEPAPASRGGLFGRMFGRGAGPAAAPVVRRELDDAMLESLEELLIASDMGVDTALRVTANLAEGRMGRRVSVAEIKELLSREIARVLEPVARPMPIYAKRPQVVLVVGVNGSGKTTTIGKLASQFRAAGKTVVIAAGDTFRAAAVEQLKVWGDRAGVPVMTAPQGSDPASLAFDAMTRAEAEGADLLMIDTAGRLQNRQDLMEELAKIVRVIRKKDPEAPHNTLLVLDATTGQNALAQVETFQKLADVSGLVMTKLDGTAKGGVLVALADRFGLPIHAIGVGEQIDDLAPFDPEDFARALTGADTQAAAA